MSLADAQAHQAKHGFLKGGDALCIRTTTMDSETSNGALTSKPERAPKPRQNATEREYGLILEAMKRRLDIDDYRPFGMRLEWGADPKTGKPMVYTPDFTVFDNFSQYEDDNTPRSAAIRLIEVKGSYIYPKDLIRFKGCRAEWPMFRFELHQKANGEWRQLF